MPFLTDNGPPVAQATIDQARAELPREYGVRTVTERGRKVVLIRVPREKPDYNYELADCALYATLADVKDAKDVIMIGDDKAVRMDPVRLRDHIREQAREDADVADRARQTMPRSPDAWSVVTSRGNYHHKGLLVRMTVANLAAATPEDFQRARAGLGPRIVETLREVQYVYFVTDSDFGRVGRRVFIDSLAPDLAEDVAHPGGHTANPIHLTYATPGGLLQKPGT